ncbi:phage major capsid protein [Streptomyces sp. NPDC050204]|uniref:phage major capsid family protein n=1 Tax=Streptomyces sp. NPDC050204 TaxID=3155514 RepID=UPI0034344656
MQSGLASFKALATGASPTSAGTFIEPDQLGLQVDAEAFQRPLRLRQLVTQGTTGSDSAEYVRMTSYTNNAAPVAEATSSAGPTAPGRLSRPSAAGNKPESALAAVKVTAPVRTIAHWMPNTQRAISDAAQVVTLIGDRDRAQQWASGVRHGMTVSAWPRRPWPSQADGATRVAATRAADAGFAERAPGSGPFRSLAQGLPSSTGGGAIRFAGRWPRPTRCAVVLLRRLWPGSRRCCGRACR